MDIKRLAAGGLSGRLTETSSGNADKTATNNAKSAPKSADTVTLSTLKDIKALEQQAKSSSVDNSARIAELKQKIKDGTFRVNPDQVAAKLIETEVLLGNSNKA
ncbi:flagellar biosynthesis anti-sigma factor FlgM [Hydrogenovibrio kuenenii]|uniref:flagellar biosynthesis anti-sigma factor FlgM n=1 Tax=Hydrogenovibrio kuenenii TaxID=63658 RepID=UPI0004B9A395|nr:flagellar biosynthesis anti-sigma factor FlgM [Hydrogenovibrio kuenenii]